MIEKKDIEKLASLARIEIAEGEKGKLVEDLESILGYVSELSDAPKPDGEEEPPYTQNVMRPDGDEFTPGEFTEEILSEAPNRADNYFKVKKIFN